MKVISSCRNLKSKTFLALLLLLLFIHTETCFSQADFSAMARLVERMDSLAKEEPPQIVYIQTSKGVYEPMEDLWFKAVNPDGTPVDVRGTLFEDTDTLVSFESEHDGMGSFVFTPEAGMKYAIRLSEPETDSVYALSEVYGEGISLQLVSRDSVFLEFKLSQSPTLGTRTVYLMGQIRGAVCCIAKGELSDELTMKIPLEEFPFQGIAEFTLFDGNLVPIEERLVYVNPEQKLYVTAELDKDRYETREKVALKITVKDENGEPAKANLGVSVYDKLHQNQSDPLNIFTYCYLTSQLRGRIYDPGYYFDEKNEDRESAIDLLMLTQGWRKYVWSAADPEQTDSVGKFAVTIEHFEEGRGNYVYLTPLGPENLGLSIILSDPLPDFRNNMLWSPLTVTDKNGEATVEFYCSDLNTGFVGTIEGLSGDGLLCEGGFEFTVIKAKPADMGK